jgi:hypothetical protein
MATTMLIAPTNSKSPWRMDAVKTNHGKKCDNTRIFDMCVWERVCEYLTYEYVIVDTHIYYVWKYANIWPTSLTSTRSWPVLHYFVVLHCINYQVYTDIPMRSLLCLLHPLPRARWRHEQVHVLPGIHQLPVLSTWTNGGTELSTILSLFRVLLLSWYECYDRNNIKKCHFWWY